MDAEFLSAALEGKIKLTEQIPKVLQEDNTKLFVTKCIAKDLAQRADKDKFWRGALMIAQKMNFLKCAHADYAHPHECIRALVKKDNRDYSRTSNIKTFKKDEDGATAEKEASPKTEDKKYTNDDEEEDNDESEIASITRGLADGKGDDQIELSTKGKGNKKVLKFNADQLIIAAQYTALRNELREVPVVPLLFFRGNVPMLEKPSEASIDYAAKLKKNAQYGGRSGMAIVQEVKSKKKKIDQKVEKLSQVSKTVANVLRATLQKEADEKANKKALSVDPDLMRRKSAKGPNPLSMKKKKKSKPLPAHIKKSQGEGKTSASTEGAQKRVRDESENASQQGQENGPSKKRVRNRNKKSATDVVAGVAQE